MRTLAITVLLALLSFPLLLPAQTASDSLRRVTESMDKEMAKRNNYYGYTPEYVEKYFTAPLTLEYDFTGVDKARLKTPPAPGIHPRVLFGPEELPSIRANLDSTKPGKLIREGIRKGCLENLTGPNAKFANQYAALIAGDETVPIHQEISLPYTVLYEAFRCLLDDDKASAVKVAAAIATIAKIDRRVLGETREKVRAKNPDEVTNFEAVGQAATQEGTLGLMYDFAYNAMTPAQRDTVRSVIAEASAGMSYVGCDRLLVSSTHSSNHIPWISRLIYLSTSIEGELGYDAGTYQRCVSAMKWFYAIGIYKSGDAFEGWGKNFLFAEHAWIAARRGEDFYALSTVRNAFRSFFVQAMHPWGGSFTFYDSDGGTDKMLYRQTDVLIYKAFFPNDPAIDFVYRNNMGTDYKDYSQPVNMRNAFGLTEGICQALFATEFNEKQTWEVAQSVVAKNLPVTFWCEDTGNMIARSAWTKDALYLNYLNRSVMGGHVYCDRGHFSIYALGRTWGIYKRMRQVPEAYQPKNRTGILVDGDGVSGAPGKCVSFQESPLAAFTATDLKPSYDYIYNYIFPNVSRQDTVRLPFSPNDFRLKPSPLPWMNILLDEMPNWQTGGIPDPAPGQPITGNPAPGAGWRKRPVPYEKAFRTAGLVRGAKPYVLIVDDINRDKAEHEFIWGMTLADDLVLEKAEIIRDPQTFRADAILAEKGKAEKDSRHLLVRMVEAENLVGEQPTAIEPVTSANPPQKDVIIPKLVFRSKSAQPNFKALLFAYQPGEELPTTTWSPDHKQLTIAWKDQADQVTFTDGTDGRTRLIVLRGGKQVVQME
jgi:hypothetical protein